MTQEQQTGNRLTEVTINTIITMVVLIKQPLSVKMADDKEYDIVWNKQHTEPELIEPGKDVTTVRGIVQIVRWLEEQTAVTDWYAQTKHYTQPNG
ncbi:hypothetical protein [Evansella clarkii]|uniref:hypothetical protein n=1 Tax=Evansella clarkii TaxID=79879 RepID=UPI000997BE58|nr:hypothetical protein [Evansella clarkii]